MKTTSERLTDAAAYVDGDDTVGIRLPKDEVALEPASSSGNSNKAHYNDKPPL